MKITLDNFCKSFGTVKVIENMNLEVESGEMIALLGPSGCGKSTTLFAICGIHKVTSGEVCFGGQIINDVPAQKRNVGVVFQSYALYPHLSVFENIAFPLRVRKLKSQQVNKKVREYASIVQIDKFLDRKPQQLSGGQQQRVALARALVAQPNVLLLDEPLANLDAKLRLEMRSEIRRIQRETGITAILVTHDQVEAMSMCDRIAIMNNGKIQQISIPDEMYNQPINSFVAGFIGNPPITFYKGEYSNSRFQSKSLSFKINGSIKNLNLHDGRPLMIGIRPEYLQPQFGDFVKAKVTFVETHGREILYDVQLEDGKIFRSVQSAQNKFSTGDVVNWGIDIDKVLFFDEKGERLA